MRKITKRTAAIATAVVIGVGGAGAAWAAWLSSATATASGTAGTAAVLTVTGMSVKGDLNPGNKAGVKFKVTNTGKYPVKVNSILFSGFGADSDQACDAVNTFQQVSPAPALPAAFEKPLAQGATAEVTWDDSLQLSGDPDNDCQGDGFHFTVTVGGTSAAS